MEKYPDWPKRLNEYIASISDKRLEWGTHDPFLMVFDSIKVITGQDLISEFREYEYSDEEAFNQMLIDVGKGTLYDTLTNKLGEPVKGARGHKGDIGFYENQCGIVLGRYVMFLSEKGYLLLKISKLEKSFKVI